MSRKRLSEKWKTAILAVSESGLPAWNLREKSFTAGKMPATHDRLEAYPPDFSDIL
jgi:hypothetical protein